MQNIEKMSSKKHKKTARRRLLYWI